MVLEVFEKVYDHPLIDEIVIVDDASDEYKYNELIRGLSNILVPVHYNDEDGYYELGKFKLFRNNKNLGMSLNKREAISKANNEWCILFDSDNILYPEYLDAFSNLGYTPLPNVIYCPEKAEPDYDFKRFSSVDRNNAKFFLGDMQFRVMLNCCNYIVNRDEYLNVYKYDEAIKESDTIHFNTLWLEAGNFLYVVPNMKYFHRRHEGSGWLQGDHEYNLKKASELQEKIKNL